MTTGLLGFLPRLGVVAAATAVLLLFVVTLVPMFPLFSNGTDLSNSWVIGLHEAMALGLSMGRDIIFTYGPYAAVSTNGYHPATDALMLFGSFVFAVCFSLLLISVGRESIGALASVVVALLLVAFFRQTDALLLAYPLLYCVHVYLRYGPLPLAGEDSRKGRHLLFLAFLLLPFGLLPLVKGSLLTICAASAFLCAGFLWYRRYPPVAVAVLVIPVAWCIGFWLLAGGALSAMPGYFVNLSLIIFGYTDAMSLWGPTSELLVYISCSTVILLAIGLAPSADLASRSFVCVAFAACSVFTGFKAGLVRHDGRAVPSGAVLLLFRSSLGASRTNHAGSQVRRMDCLDAQYAEDRRL